MGPSFDQRSIDALKAILAREDSVLFLGSGVSLWAGLPSWSRLIEELAEFLERQGTNADLVRHEAQKGDLLQAASYGFDKLTKQQVADFIRMACRSGVAKPHEIHRKIVNLGPRCFITTNYDDLIEQSLRLWQPDRIYRPAITNRHLTETAEIVHARATDFVFKPHGDAGDSESIILTREQYRLLLAQGERHAALDALKMLLASRPVIYIGFGLRDPDFMYVRDLLVNTYKGGTRDHYAIMADVHDQERDYWRRNYGIQLVGYKTAIDQNSHPSHMPLLALLDELLTPKIEKQKLAPFRPDSAEVLLALARHAAALGRFPTLTREYLIRVRAEFVRNDGLHSTHATFDHSTVHEFLTVGPHRAALTGLPGAGKSYSMRRAVADLADALHEACLISEDGVKDVTIPLFVDLKLYRGDLASLVGQTLPAGLQMADVLQSYRVKIFLDSFNELPREYLENGSYEADFRRFFEIIGNASFVIGSRTLDGLDRLGLPSYCLDHIDDDIVKEELERLHIAVDGRFRREMIRLLQRPFFFQYVTSASIRLPSEPHPRDFYRVLLANASESFLQRFGSNLDIESALSPIAYDALNRGEEAFPLAGFMTILQVGPSAEALARAGISAMDFANWLVSCSLLVPYSGGRIAFVHQSITEYLAATELAKFFISAPTILLEKLALKRWDQALFLTLSLLPTAEAEIFLREVVKCDFELALNASKYLESGRDPVIAALLAEIPARLRKDVDLRWHASWIVENLPVNISHEPQLRQLIELGDGIGGIAAAKLLSINGGSFKEEALELFLNNFDDYNFCCNGIAPALASWITTDDLARVVKWADELDKMVDSEGDEDAARGFRNGCAVLLDKMDMSVVVEAFLPKGDESPIPKMRGLVLCEILRGIDNTASLETSAELLLRGVDEATVSIYFIGNFTRVGVSWESFTTKHVDRLEALLDNQEVWAADALRLICENRADLAQRVEEHAGLAGGLRRAVMLYCAGPSNLEPIFEELDRLTTLSGFERQDVNFRILDHIHFDWTGKESLFVKLMKLKDPELTGAILSGQYPPDLPGLGRINLGDIEWWLDWMSEVLDANEDPWFAHSLAGLITEYADVESEQLLLAEFQREGSKYRGLLLRHLILHIAEVSTDLLNENTIGFALADLRHSDSVTFDEGHLLGRASTERFVMDRLLPLLPIAEGVFAENLRAVLNQAGKRHGKRYVLR